MLRDMSVDLTDGFVNVPREYLEAHRLKPENLDSPQLRSWVRDRVEQARGYFHRGKQYLDGLNVLRCKLVGYWYCARFEGILDTIERDDYVLRPVYNERRKLSTWLKIAGLTVSITLKHLLRKVVRLFST
jgi:phytoene/squalene synthetase